MDKLIEKTVELALENGLIEVKNKIIVDSTHTNAMFSHISPREELIRQAKNLRKSVYKIDETMHDKMPKKRESTCFLEDQIEYTKELLNLLTEDGRFEKLQNIKEQMDYIKTEELYSERYKIEAKNVELKNSFSYNKANACGKIGITIQGATTLFLTNMKRIIKLKEEKNKNID